MAAGVPVGGLVRHSLPGNRYLAHRAAALLCILYWALYGSLKPYIEPFSLKVTRPPVGYP